MIAGNVVLSIRFIIFNSVATFDFHPQFNERLGDLPNFLRSSLRIKRLIDSTDSIIKKFLCLPRTWYDPTLIKMDRQSASSQP